MRKPKRDPQAEAFRLANIAPTLTGMRRITNGLKKGDVGALSVVAMVRDESKPTGFAEVTIILDAAELRLAMIGGLSQLGHLLNMTEGHERMRAAARQVDPASLVGAA